jgi:beta-N-acetylhexosaminidase
MSLDEKVGQLFMTSFYGSDVTNVTAAQAKANLRVLGTNSLGEAIDRYHPGGVIYFTWSGNLTSASAAANLSNEVQARGAASNSGAPMLIATDQEGGSITRLPAPATQFAGNMAVGATGRIGMSRSVGQAIGEELRALGLNVALAPDADVNVNPANPIIGLRSFGSDPAAVSTMTAAMVGGFQGAGVAATIKHFPGHGDTDVDSHSQLPLITHTLEQWRTIDEPPFVAGIAAGADLVMAGHLAVPALDTSGTPSSLSEPILTGILREQLGFDGVVITDSLEMGALRTGYGDDRIPVLAILAGADILLMPPRLPVAFDAVKAAVQSGEISVARLDQSVRRILKLKEKLGLYEAAPVSVAAAGASLGTATHRTIERNVASASITLLANDNAVLPIAAATGAPYLVIGTASAPVLIVRDALRKRGVVAGTYVTGARPSNAVISAAVARAASYQTVIDLTLNADQDTQQQALVARLAATGKRIVTVAIGRPYDQAYYRAAVNLCTYSSSAASLQGAVRVILGEVGPVGRLPVMIPVAGAPSQVLYPLGFGLGYTP